MRISLGSLGGLALGAFAAPTARLAGGTVWTVTPARVTEQRRLRVERRVDRDAIESLELGRRRRTGTDVKAAARPRDFELCLREVGSPLGAIRLSFESEAEACALGLLLADVLGVPLR